MINNLLIAALCVIWGATWVVIKIGLSESPPFFGAAFRFLIAVVVLGALIIIGRKSLPRGRVRLGWILLPGFFMYFGSYGATYYSEQYLDAALAAILFASFPFFVAIGAHFYIPGERLSLFKILGLIVGFLGIVVIFHDGLASPTPGKWWAMGIMMLSPLSSAIASVLIKRHLHDEDPTVANFLQMLFGILILFPFALMSENISDFHWTMTSIAAVSFLAVFGSVFTFVSYYHLLKSIEVTRLSLIAFVTPITAAILGWIVLGEKLNLATAVGALLVFAGIWIVNILAPKRALALAVRNRGRD
ncbi:MAG: DMT family transporter [candidate division Zixibacteria bacterium]|nr:DMT family transporter [candidate division Zixibacteria bacterium]